MIYLDNAATTLQKPPGVGSAMRWGNAHAAGAGRSAHKPAMIGAKVLYDTRVLAAQLFGVQDERRVVFTYNATHALNLALYALAQRYNHFAVSPFEHNAVLRPMLEQVRHRNKTLTVLKGTLWNDDMLLESAKKAIKDGAECFILCHVSNVFGYIQPLEQLDTLLTEHEIPLLLDASQSAGVLPLDAAKLHSVAAVCMPGHKGLYGPTGTGLLLWLSPELPRPLLLGGTGSRSESAEMPEFLPDRLESGTVNTTGIAGLFEGLKMIQQIGAMEILRHEQQLRAFAVEGLREIPGIEIFAAPHTEQQTGVLSFRSRQFPAEVIARRLAERGVCVRAGLHCAPLAHQTMRTEVTGTVRISPGWFENHRQIQRFAEIMEHISGKESAQILS